MYRHVFIHLRASILLVCSRISLVLLSPCRDRRPMCVCLRIASIMSVDFSSSFSVSQYRPFDYEIWLSLFLCMVCMYFFASCLDLEEVPALSLSLSLLPFIVFRSRLSRSLVTLFPSLCLSSCVSISLESISSFFFSYLSSLFSSFVEVLT